VLRRSLFVALLALSVAPSCADAAGRAGGLPADDVGRVATVQSDHALPSNTLADWRTYGMHLVTVTAIGEDALPVQPAFEEVGEGSIDRTVDLRIDEVHWSAEGAWGASIPLPRRITMVAEGWIFGEYGRRPIREAGGTRLEVGARYVLLFTQMSPDVVSSTTGEPWAILLPHGALALVEGEVTVPPDNPLAGDLDGRTPAEIADLLRSAKVVPAAEPYLDLPPFDRYLVATGQARE
jgi:hypothetical protein